MAFRFTPACTVCCAGCQTYYTTVWGETTDPTTLDWTEIVGSWHIADAQLLCSSPTVGLMGNVIVHDSVAGGTYFTIVAQYNLYDLNNSFPGVVWNLTGTGDSADYFVACIMQNVTPPGGYLLCVFHYTGSFRSLISSVAFDPAGGVQSGTLVVELRGDNGWSAGWWPAATMSGFTTVAITSSDATINDVIGLWALQPEGAVDTVAFPQLSTFHSWDKAHTNCPAAGSPCWVWDWTGLSETTEDDVSCLAELLATFSSTIVVSMGPTKGDTVLDSLAGPVVLTSLGGMCFPWDWTGSQATIDSAEFSAIYGVLSGEGVPGYVSGGCQWGIAVTDDLDLSAFYGRGATGQVQYQFCLYLVGPGGGVGQWFVLSVNMALFGSGPSGVSPWTSVGQYIYMSDKIPVGNCLSTSPATLTKVYSSDPLPGYGGVGVWFAMPDTIDLTDAG